ncbi:MAG: alkaline phosphatase family protein [Candidatus Liptonbacteria bacterium]|nr:alkaline phosphatase family protein [Candidatus Liptonbacteria bacterium]
MSVKTMNHEPRKRVFVFGIDGATPDLVFRKWRKDLPAMSRLMADGVYARSRSSVPPISIAAWGSLFSGKDPSELGVFGYNYRKPNGEMDIITAEQVREPRVWDILDKQNKRTIALYIPLTFPVKKLNGAMVSDFLTPSADSACAYPLSLRAKIKKMPRPDLFFDVAVGLAGHKGMDPGDLIKKTYIMSDMQIALAKELLAKKDWDLFAMVMLGSDRLQHMLWNHFDETHPRYVRGSKYKNALKEYYKYLDKNLGQMLTQLPQDTTVIIASDHGMVPQYGKISINNWLMQNGYLTLKTECADKIKTGKVRFNTKMVDMGKSTAWGSGAYHARIFINKRLITKGYNKFRDRLIRQLKQIPDDKGRKIKTEVFASEKIYKNPKHPECPDLTVYFDDLRWASNPDFGGKGIYAYESAAGADSAGHSREGLIIASGTDIKRRGDIGTIDIRQAAPTILKHLDAKIPKDIKLKPFA